MVVKTEREQETEREKLFLSRPSLVKTTDLHPVNMGSTPAAAGTHMSHWSRQEGHLAKINPCKRHTSVFDVTSAPFSKQSTTLHLDMHFLAANQRL